MNTIHMDTVSVKSLADNMNWEAKDLESSARKLRSVGNSITDDWIGGRSILFQLKYRSVVKKLQNSFDDLQDLAHKLNHEINQWQDGAANFGDSAINTWMGGNYYSGGGGGGGGGGAWGPPSWFDRFKGIYKHILKPFAFMVDDESNFLAFLFASGIPLFGKIDELNDNLAFMKWLKWLKIGGDAYNNWTDPNNENYGEKAAAIIADTAFSLIRGAVVKAIATAVAGTAAAATVVATLAQALTGIGIPTGIATAVAGATISVGVWVGVDAALTYVTDLIYKDLGLREFIIEKLGGFINQQLDSSPSGIPDPSFVTA